MKKTLIFIFLSVFLINFGNQSFSESDEKLVILHTDLGKIVIEFFRDDAPNHTANFIKLSENGFYNDTVFHRIIPGFMIQGGDPNTKNGDESTWGMGGPDNPINAEFNTIKHKRGIVSMARSTHVDSAGSQFFIIHKDNPNQPNIQDWTNLDEQYTVFGRIITQESFDTLDKIASVETKTKNIPINPEQVRIIKTEIVNRSEVVDLLELENPERIMHVYEILDYTEYTNEKLPFVFSYPVSSFIQEQQNPNEPVISITGQKIGLIPPIINVIREEMEQKSFEQKIGEYDKFLDEGVNTGKVEILSKERIEVNGIDAYATDRIQELQSQNLIFNGRIKQIIFSDNDKFYTLTYYNDKKYFEQQYPIFEKFVNSFQITSKDTPLNKDEGGGCLIATATYGTELAPQVQFLREIRDDTVMSTASGIAFMSGFNQLYYSFSPTIADLEREHPIFKEAVKITLTPMLTSLSILNYVNIDSEHEMLGYGVGIILMNVGMYCILPFMIIQRLKNFLN